ncbi:hypothetical protein CkaCkLH20_03233 [Colletotrichum karsti]|uniref:Uncharacterized protein n=1 Tax=Colletotrichum karsti TaxID=1095194 RepID=A0A9P6LN04_9PEZI|nr:uncharacterized protein CkaCkLH20_03233 [Colletotrichum karsti]KAF9879000.1 hypothetical protein CkaCkLH20_03233 [Colletotrichum karsti]
MPGLEKRALEEHLKAMFPRHHFIRVRHRNGIEFLRTTNTTTDESDWSQMERGDEEQRDSQENITNVKGTTTDEKQGDVAHAGEDEQDEGEKAEDEKMRNAYLSGLSN